MGLRGSAKRDAFAVDHDDVPRARDRAPVDVPRGVRRALRSKMAPAPRRRRFTGSRRANSWVSAQEKGLRRRRWLKFRCDFDVTASVDELRPPRNGADFERGTPRRTIKL